MTNQPKRTMVAQQALQLSDLLNMRFANAWMGTDPPKHLVVQAPEESTEGGKKARQAITLAPQGGSGFGTIMVGWLDVAQRRAELRTHPVVADLYAQRYHKPFDVAREPYDNVMREIQSMLSAQSFQIGVEDKPHAAPVATISSRPPPPSGSGGKGITIALGVLAVLAVVALGAFILLR